MNLRLPFASVLLGLALPLALAACGNKGPLVLPDQPAADAPVAAASAEAAPADAAPAASEAEVAPPPASDQPPVEPPPPPGGRDG